MGVFKHSSNQPSYELIYLASTQRRNGIRAICSRSRAIPVHIAIRAGRRSRLFDLILRRHLPRRDSGLARRRTASTVARCRSKLA